MALVEEISETKKTKFISITRRYIKTPFRILAKVRDFYINSMTQCAGKVTYGGGTSAMAFPTPHVSSGLSKSFSVNSIRLDNDDYSELIRVASRRRLGEKIEAELLRQHQESTAAMAAISVTRSQSVAIGRINEDKACDFGDDHFLFLRSRSYAVNQRPNFF